MLVLVENSTGYALITKIPGEGKKNLKLDSFYQFQTRWEAIKSFQKLIKGKIPKNLKNFLLNNVLPGNLLIVNDERLRVSMKIKFGKNFIKIQKKSKIYREIRKNLEKLFKNIGISDEKFKTISLSHALFCQKLQFEGSRIDTMVIQAIRLFDEIEKEINGYSLRLREWYSWHFPELSNLVTDNILFVRLISRIETKNRLKFIDLSDLVSVSFEKEIKEAAEVSLGVEIFTDDLLSILSLCNQIISFSEFKILLQNYIKNRMFIIAPNLTAIVGERVGARLISHSGSLSSLSKLPASTIQILGAEKSLFRSLKNKTFSPKYGIIYHARIVSSVSNTIKGKVSRITAGKATLSARVDALGETKYGGSIGLRNKKKIEHRIFQLEAFSFKKEIFFTKKN